MIKRVLVFLGWSLSTFLMLVEFTGFIENPLMSIAVILWGLITFPPILKRTKKYGRTWNITGRIFTFILSLVIAGQAPQPVKTASEQVKAPQPTIAAKPKVIPSVEPSVVAPPTVSVSPSPILEQQKQTKNLWYQGSTLSKATALEWQEATYENKLATCADIIAKLWKDDALNSSIQNQIASVDDMKPFAEQLVVDLDEVMRKIPDQKKNEVVYANQTVTEMAVATLILNKWTK